MYDEIKFNTHFHNDYKYQNNDKYNKTLKFKSELTRDIRIKNNRLVCYFMDKNYNEKFERSTGTISSFWDSSEEIDFDDYHPMDTSYQVVLRKLTPDWILFLRKTFCEVIII